MNYSRYEEGKKVKNERENGKRNEKGKTKQGKEKHSIYKLQ
jgi:hypothetical protein